MARTLSVDTDILDEMVYFLYQMYTLLAFQNKRADKGVPLACPMVGFNRSSMLDYFASTISRMLASFF